MNNITIDEIILFAKILAYASGDRSIVLTNTDKDLAYEALKRMTDRRTDMTEQQKNNFKMLIDLCKNQEAGRDILLR